MCHRARFEIYIRKELYMLPSCAFLALSLISISGSLIIYRGVGTKEKRFLVKSIMLSNPEIVLRCVHSALFNLKILSPNSFFFGANSFVSSEQAFAAACTSRSPIELSTNCNNPKATVLLCWCLPRFHRAVQWSHAIMRSTFHSLTVLQVHLAQFLRA